MKVSYMPIIHDYDFQNQRQIISIIKASVIESHETQAYRNHNQSLDTLARRGGVSMSEAIAIIEDRPWKAMEFKDALKRLLELCK